MGGPFRGRAAAAIAALLLLVACGQRDEDPAAATSVEAEQTDDGAARGGRADPTGDPAQPAGRGPQDTAGADEVDVWFAREHASGVWIEPETVPLTEATVEVLRAAVDGILRGSAGNPELTSFVPPGTRLLDVRIEDRVALVDLSDDIMRAAGSSTQELAFAQQLAQTCTQFDTVDAVRLLVNGEPVDELWGHVDWSEPITADPQLLSPIIITEPSWGATVAAGTVTASGTSVTFESTVALRLIDPAGTVVEDTFTTAAQPSTGERGAWSHTFQTPATTPGTWTIEAREPDPSGGEGRPPFTTSVRFEVS